MFLIRHGRSTWNNQRRIQGYQNPHLAPEGKISARSLGRHLQERFGPFSRKKDVLLTSPLFRALETGRYIAASIRLPVRLRRHLREAGLGEWEGKSVDEIRKTDGRRLRQWYRDPTRVRLAGGEPIPKFRGRVRREIRTLLRKYKNKRCVLIVTHGGWISTLLTDVVEIPLSRLWTFVLDNCSLTRLHWDGKKLVLRSFNETACQSIAAAGGTSSFRPPGKDAPVPKWTGTSKFRPLERLA